MWVLQAGELKRVRIWKHRWLDSAEGTGTFHSRPPDEMGRLSVCVLVYVLAILGWLSAPCGLVDHEPIVFDLKNIPSRRTLQRWLQRALPRALETQQAYRLAVIERCEPRPVESLFPGGLSPPEWPRRLWRDPPLVDRLWRAYVSTRRSWHGLTPTTTRPSTQRRARRRSTGGAPAFPRSTKPTRRSSGWPSCGARTARRTRPAASPSSGAATRSTQGSGESASRCATIPRHWRRSRSGTGGAS